MHRFKPVFLQDALVFVEIFTGDVVLGNFVGVNFLLVCILGGLHAGYNVSLEGVPFLQQLLDAF